MTVQERNILLNKSKKPDWIIISLYSLYVLMNILVILADIGVLF